MKNHRQISTYEVLKAVTLLCVSLDVFSLMFSLQVRLSLSAFILLLTSSIGAGGSIGWPIATVIWGRQFALRGFIWGSGVGVFVTLGIPTILSLLRPI